MPINNTACFFGHRVITETEELKSYLSEKIEKLITKMKVDTFLFGSKSRFNDLCYELVTNLKEKYPYIKRVYVRAEYQYINDDYKNFLLKSFENTYYPEKIIGAGKAAYIERNYEIINNSHFCIVYYDQENTPTIRKSGTEIALKYAKKNEKNYYNFSKIILMLLYDKSRCILASAFYVFKLLYPLYFFRVARPPRIWRSLLFFSSTFFTSPYSCGSSRISRSVTSLCTVDLLILKTFAAARTVAPVSAMYSPNSIARWFANLLIQSTPKRTNILYEFKIYIMPKSKTAL